MPFATPTLAFSFECLFDDRSLALLNLKDPTFDCVANLVEKVKMAIFESRGGQWLTMKCFT